MDMNDIPVSVIVPVYGTEVYLPACIDSIRGQSHKNLQIILVDDQSPDRCPAICDRYARTDERILVIHQENRGVSGARNTGLDHASGSYIMFVDSDDEISPDAVAVLLRDAIEHGADIAGADETGSSGACTVYRGEDTLLFALDGKLGSESVCSKLFKTELLADVRFVEGKSNHEDGFFVFECCLKQPTMAHRDAGLYRYNQRPGSGSRGAFSDKYLSILYFCQRKMELISVQYPQFMDQARNMEARTNLQFLDVLCRTTDKRYRHLQKQCVRTVRRLYPYHRPVNGHHRTLARIVRMGLYPVYKWAVRMKYYR